MVCSITQGDHN